MRTGQSARYRARMRNIVCCGALLLLASGCDKINGVESHVTLKGPVDVSCVNVAISDVSEAGSVIYQRHENSSTELLPKQRQVLTIMHSWAYGERGASILQINQTPDGWEYWNTRRRMGAPVPDEEIAQFLPLMRKVNRTIQRRCGLPVGALRYPSGENRMKNGTGCCKLPVSAGVCRWVIRRLMSI